MARDHFNQAEADAARIGRGEGELTSPHGFVEMLEVRQQFANSLLCVGLDPVVDKIPASFRGKWQDNSVGAQAVRRDAAVLTAFNRKIVDAVAPHVSAFKPNIAFYERYGVYGVQALKTSIRYIKDAYPTIPVILDAKRADIGATNAGYADMVKQMGADAVTVNPYFGIEGKGALDPFLSLGDIGVIVLCRTSNPEAAQMQDVIVKDPVLGEVPYYMMVARMSEEARQKNPNVAIVVGATAPQQLREVRSIFKGQILVPGLGKQGGRPEDLAGVFVDEGGIIANNATAIIHASTGEDFIDAAARAALDWQLRINAVRGLPAPEGPSREEKLAARQERVMQILKDVGAFREGHFLLKSGKHSDKYVDKSMLTPNRRVTREVCSMMADDFRNLGVDVVVGPAVGGIILSQVVAEELGGDTQPLYAEKGPRDENDQETFILRGDYARLVEGRRILLVEDILTTGGSVAMVKKTVEEAGGEIVGIAGIFNRGGITAEALGVPILSTLVNLSIPSWNPGPETCEPCRLGTPINSNVGHGARKTA